MKTKILYWLVGVCLFTSCSLDEKIYDTPMKDTFIEKESDVDFLVAAVYGDLQSANYYKYNMNFLTMYVEDVMAVYSGTHQPYAKRSISASSAEFNPIWNRAYIAINDANNTMESVKAAAVLSEEFKNRIIGEMSFMRAYVYFDLVRLFGGVPLHTQSISNKVNFYPERASVDAVYKRIFEDLELACKHCLPYSKQPVKEKGRATLGAAQGIYALANLTYANYLELNNRSGEAVKYYELAVEYADYVIKSGEYHLLDNYADLFDVEKEEGAYNEVVFGIQFARDPKAVSFQSKGSEWAYYMQPSNRYNVCGNVTDGKGANVTRIQAWFYDECTTGDYENDYRSEISFLTRYKYQNQDLYRVTYPRIPNTANKESATTEPFPYLDKYKDPKGLQARNNDNDFFVLRLAEVYLIKAEALNELQRDMDQAYEAFNKVRERARKANGTLRTTPADLSGPLSKEQFRMKVFNERGLELVGEGKRWFDCVRMRYIDNMMTMQEYRYNVYYPNMDPTIYKLPSFDKKNNKWYKGRVFINCVGTWSKRYLLWPIASEEIDRNHNIVQNTEYGW